MRGGRSSHPGTSDVDLSTEAALQRHCVTTDSGSAAGGAKPPSPLPAMKPPAVAAAHSPETRDSRLQPRLEAQQLAAARPVSGALPKCWPTGGTGNPCAADTSTITTFCRPATSSGGIAQPVTLNGIVFTPEGGSIVVTSEDWVTGDTSITFGAIFTGANCVGAGIDARVANTDPPVPYMGFGIELNTTATVLNLTFSNISFFTT